MKIIFIKTDTKYYYPIQNIAKGKLRDLILPKLEIELSKPSIQLHYQEKRPPKKYVIRCTAGP